MTWAYFPNAAAATAASDSSLVALAAAGDTAAFRAIFHRHAPSVRRFLCDLLRDGSAADEALQEVFVRAHRKLQSLRDPDKLGSWLLGIARFVAREQRREDGARVTREVAGDEDDGELQLIASGPSPEESLLDAEAEDVLRTALERLEDDRRAAVVFRIDHGLSYDEIADRMGWPLQKVKNEIHRGRLQMRAAIKTYLGARA